MDVNQYIVIIRSSAIGDVVLSTACLDYIASLKMKLKVIWIGTAPSLSLLREHPVIEKCIPIIKDSSFDRRELDFYNIKGVLDLQSNIRSIRLAKFIAGVHSCPVEHWEKGSLKRSYLVFQARLRRRSSSVIRQTVIPKYETMVASLKKLFVQMNIEVDQYLKGYPRLYLAASEVHKNYFSEQEMKWVGISPGASYFAKRLPLELWKDVLFRISQLRQNVGICCFGANSDVADAEFLESYSKSIGLGFINLTGKLKLDETASCLSKVDLFIGNDSGLGHIAEALGTSSFVFFGPTVEEFGFIPWRESSRCFSSNLACRPCSKHGKSECRYNDYQCYSNIDFVNFESELVNYFGV